MNDATPTGERQPDWRSVMVDVSGLSLSELAAEGDDVLAHCLRRLVADLDSGEPSAGFNSAF